MAGWRILGLVGEGGVLMNERTDILISRVVDGVATGADLNELEGIGASQPSVWRELALAQRDQALLSQAVARVICVADAVGLPREVETHDERVSPGSRWKKASVWGGWAAAAAMALAFVGANPRAGTQQAGLIPSMNVLKDGLTADQAWELYEATGSREQRLIGVMPERVLIQATPSEDGKSVHMVFLRQLIETKTVDQLYKPTVTETGQCGVVPVDFLRDVPLVPTPAKSPVPTKRRLPAV